MSSVPENLNSVKSDQPGIHVSVSEESQVDKIVVIGNVQGEVLIQAELPDELDMIRRTFLKNATRGAGATILPPTLQAIELLRSRTNKMLLRKLELSPDVMDQLEIACNAHLDAYAMRPPIPLLEDLVLDFAKIRTLFEIRRSIASQRWLLRTLGRLAGVISVVLNDLGQTSVASDWMQTSRIAAREAGEHGFEAWTYAREAFFYLHYHRSAKVAINLARAAKDKAEDLICSAAVMAPSVEARALARLEDNAQSLISLDEAESHFDRIGNPGGAGVLGWSLRQLEFSAGKTLTTLGETERAIGMQDRALRGFSPEEILDPTLTGLDRAQALIRGGNVVEGCHAAITLLESVPPSYCSPLIGSWVDDALLAIPSKMRRLTAVKDFIEARSHLAERTKS